MPMTFEQEKEHIDFLITRLQFLKRFGSYENNYESIRKRLKPLSEDLRIIIEMQENEEEVNDNTN